MKAFIIGGSGNGKSAFAEKVAAKLGGKMIYIATMPIFSEEDVKVVERHHKLRAGRGFETLERPQRIEDVPDHGETVLLECMSMQKKSGKRSVRFLKERAIRSSYLQKLQWMEIHMTLQRNNISER